jgi:hypothetical protein
MGEIKKDDKNGSNDKKQLFKIKWYIFKKNN